MKNSKELKELRSDLIGELESIKLVAENEERDLTKEENENVDSILTKIDDNDVAITRTEKVENNLKLAAASSGAKVSSVNSDKVTRGWSLFKAVNEIRNGGQLTGIEAEMHQEAQTEARKGLQGIGLPTFMTEKRAIDQTGSAIAPTAVAAFADALTADSLWNRVGVNNLGTVAADTVVPISGGSAVTWETEVTAANDGGVDFGKVTLTPKRLAGFANVSNQLLIQNGAGVEAAVMRDMGRNMGNKIDAAMFGSANVGGGSPNAIVTTGGTLTFVESAAGGSTAAAADALEAIQTVANDHGLDGNLGFVSSWELYSAIKAAPQVASVYPAYVDDRLMGYPGWFSSGPASVAGVSGDALFGDFSRVYFAQFGPSNILVDPYTEAKTGNVQLVMNNFFDWGVASGASFVAYTTAL